MGAPYAHRGFMTAAVSALIPFAFGTLRLHRIEAACIPDQCRLDQAPGKDRLSTGGFLRGIVHRWVGRTTLYARLHDA
jgi:ribosomal-protein-alanine N-acetyltransferase